MCQKWRIFIRKSQRNFHKILWLLPIKSFEIRIGGMWWIFKLLKFIQILKFIQKFWNISEFWRFFWTFQNFSNFADFLWNFQNFTLLKDWQFWKVWKTSKIWKFTRFLNIFRMVGTLFWGTHIWSNICRIKMKSRWSERIISVLITVIKGVSVRFEFPSISEHFSISRNFLENSIISRNFWNSWYLELYFQRLAYHRIFVGFTWKVDGQRGQDL